MFFKELQQWEEARRVIIYLHREMTIKFPQGREEALSELTVITNGQTDGQAHFSAEVIIVYMHITITTVFMICNFFS